MLVVNGVSNDKVDKWWLRGATPISIMSPFYATQTQTYDKNTSTSHPPHTYTLSHNIQTTFSILK